MKVFISSLITGFEDFRQAARDAVTTLRHEPVMAEDFGAKPTSPQISCLDGVRRADAVVLILGERYGWPQPTSGISATHEEYREARGRKPIFVFLQQGVDPDLEQTKFLAETQAWEGGLFRASFSNSDDLEREIIRALVDHQLAHTTAPLDLKALSQGALDLLPAQRRSGLVIDLAIVGGPEQELLRPAELEDPRLMESVHQAALFGPTRIFDPAKGAERQAGNQLSIEQEDGVAMHVDERGRLLLRLSVAEPRETGVLTAIIEETVQRQLVSGFAFANWLLDAIDPTQRLSHVAIAARLAPDDFTTWRTRAEQEASPTRMSIPFGNEDRPAVVSTYPRPMLRLEAQRLAEDLTIRLRRQWKG